MDAKVFLMYSLATCLAFFSPGEALAQAEAGPAVLSRELSAGDDYQLSPFTGYTREHWIEIAGKLAAGFVQYMDPETGMPAGLERAVPELPNAGPLSNPKPELYEAFERSMMVVAAYTAASGKSTFPGYDGDLVRPYLTGIIRGTDPDDPNYWKDLSSHSIFGNAVVISILTSPGFFWEPLSDKQKLNLARWLKQLTQRQAWDNNHWYFHMSPAPLLDKEGVPYDRARLDSFFLRLLGFYRGRGWYIDGDNQGFDYYNNWGFHLFNLLLYHADRRWRDEFGEVIAGHTRKFLGLMPYFFGADGAPVPWGRSLSYRFASLAPLGWAQKTGTSPLESGLARRIASGCLKYFWENGCMSARGLLEPGYLGPNHAVGEIYIRRGAPYWAGTGLSCLVLAADDPFWTAREKPLPVEIGTAVKVIEPAGMVVRVNAETGESRLYKIGEPFDHAGRWQRNAKYFGHAYSSQIGFALTGEGGPKLAANSSAASADGENWNYRANPRPRKIGEYENVSEYALNDTITGSPGTVITHTFIGRHGEVHVVYHTALKPLYLTVGGYGIQVLETEKAVSRADATEITVTTGRFYSFLRVLGGVSGKLEMREVKPREGFGHTHLFGGRSAFPVWTSDSAVPRGHAVVLYVNAAGGTLPEEPAVVTRSAEDQLTLEFAGRRKFLTTRSNYWAE